jgi:hypothetical protein
MRDELPKGETVRRHTQEAAATIDTIKSLSRVTDEELGAVVGVSGNGFSKRLRQARAGTGDLSIEQCARIADGFGWPLHVLFLPRAEFLAWLAANDPAPTLRLDLTDDGHISGSDWITRLANYAHLADGPGGLLTGAHGTAPQALTA